MISLKLVLILQNLSTLTLILTIFLIRFVLFFFFYRNRSIDRRPNLSRSRTYSFISLYIIFSHRSDHLSHRRSNKVKQRNIKTAWITCLEVSNSTHILNNNSYLLLLLLLLLFFTYFWCCFAKVFKQRTNFFKNCYQCNILG